MSNLYLDQTIKDRDTTAKTPKSTITHHARTPYDGANGKTMGQFTGEVWLDKILESKEAFISLVNFTPCARTNWHRHDNGQLLKVTGGSGWYCDQGDKPKRIAVGDVIWCRHYETLTNVDSAPGTVHWHGADDGCYMVHEASSFGKVDWYDPVTDEEYAAKKG